MVDKKYDLIVHGATGFTGKLICEYLFNHLDIKSVKWAISGRNNKKLETISHKYNVDYFQVDSFDKKSLDNITLNCKVIISVVGPYALYGKKLVQSCVENNCHYLDITGESTFVKYVRENFTSKSVKTNTMVINCCGFESMPTDIGVYYNFKKSKQENLDIKCFLKSRGKISGGTWASFLNHFDTNKISLNNHKINKTKKVKSFYYENDIKKWALIFPDIDRSIIMSSSKYYKYGADFNFTKYLTFKTLWQVIGLIIPLIVISFLAKYTFTRNWLKTFIPSGTGPSKDERSKHWFNFKMISKTKKQKYITEVNGGDPGYGETSKFISEMALTIIHDFDKLTNNKGVISPAECGGEALLKRLINSNIKFSHKSVNV